MATGFHIFLSAVTEEFDPTCRRLHDILSGDGHHVHFRGNLPQSSVDLVEKLDELIAPCDVVVHLVGHQPGFIAEAKTVAPFLKQFRKDKPFLARWPELVTQLGDFSGITFTQWEALLALHRGVPLFVYAPADRGQDFAQQRHLASLERAARFAESFKTPNDLCAKVKRDVRHEWKSPRLARHLRTYLESVVSSFAEYEKQTALSLALRASIAAAAPSAGKAAVSRPFDLHKHLAESPARVSVITGDGGMGKTSTLHRIVAQRADTELGRLKAGTSLAELEIPIYVSLDDYPAAGGYASLVSAIADALTDNERLPGSERFRLLLQKSPEPFFKEPGRVLLCFDNLHGVEEVLLQTVLTAMHKILEKHDNVRIVLTSSSEVAARHDDKLQKALHDRLTLRLSPLSAQQVRSSLRRSVGDDARVEELMGRLTRQRMLEFARVPLFLHVIAKMAEAGIPLSALTPASLIDTFVREALRESAEPLQPEHAPLVFGSFSGKAYQFLTNLAVLARQGSAACHPDDWQTAANSVTPPISDVDDFVRRLIDRGLLRRSRGDHVQFRHSKYQAYFGGRDIDDTHIRQLIELVRQNSYGPAYKIRQGLIKMGRMERFTDELAFAFARIEDPQTAELVFSDFAAVNADLAARCIVDNRRLPRRTVKGHLRKMVSEFRLAKTDLTTSCVMGVLVFAFMVLGLDAIGYGPRIRSAFSELGAVLPILPETWTWPRTAAVLLCLTLLLEWLRRYVNSRAHTECILPILSAAHTVGGARARWLSRTFQNAVHRAWLPLIPRVRQDVRDFDYSVTSSEREMLDDMGDAEERAHVLSVQALLPGATPAVIASACKHASTWPDPQCRQALRVLSGQGTSLPKADMEQLVRAILDNHSEFRYPTRRRAYRLGRSCELPGIGIRHLIPSTADVRRAISDLQAFLPIVSLVLAIALSLCLVAALFWLQERISELIWSLIDGAGSSLRSRIGGCIAAR